MRLGEQVVTIANAKYPTLRSVSMGMAGMGMAGSIMHTVMLMLKWLLGTKQPDTGIVRGRFGAECVMNVSDWQWDYN